MPKPKNVLYEVSRNERRIILKAEDVARKTGRWGFWETKTFPKGTIGNSDKGWLRDVEETHKNKVFAVLVRDLEDGTRHFAITCLSGTRPTWPEMQRIKDELAGEDATGVEVYPPKTEIVDAADMYHLWILPNALPFSLATREAVSA